MANRRLVSLDIVDTDAFLDMPASSQLLYFHLNTRADDDGFIASPHKIMRILGAQKNDLDILFSKKFVIVFPKGICVIKHWRINNSIRKDRYTETKYIDEKNNLFIRENGAYTLTKDDRSLPVPNGHFTAENLFISGRLPSGRPMGALRQGKLSKGKVREEKRREEKKNSYGELKNVKLKPEEYQKLLDLVGEEIVSVMIFELDTYIGSTGRKYNSHYATILSWLRRKTTELKSKRKLII